MRQNAVFERGLMPEGDTERRSPSLGSWVLWGFLWQTMWLWAIFGPLYLVLAIILYFVDQPDWHYFTSGHALALSGFIAVVGVSFTWLRMKGYIKFCGE
jgi:hypothetical protein